MTGWVWRESAFRMGVCGGCQAKEGILTCGISVDKAGCEVTKTPSTEESWVRGECQVSTSE